MSSRRRTGIAAAALLAWLVAWPAVAGAQDPAAAELAEEYARQQDIYRSRGREIPRGYVLDRSLKLYTDILPGDFTRELTALGPEDRWLDVGAGQGRAILDYHASRPGAKRSAGKKRRVRKARSVALSIEDRRTPEWHKSVAALEPDRVQYLYGKPLRDYSPEELGRFRLVTDVMGGFSYAADLSRFVQGVMGLLETGGTFLTVLQDVEQEGGTNKPYYDGYPFTTEIENPGGGKTTICSWLKSIRCAEVLCQGKEEWSPPLEAYHVRKICEDVSVPALVPVSFLAGTPPQRGYRLSVPPVPALEPSKQKPRQLAGDSGSPGDRTR